MRTLHSARLRLEPQTALHAPAMFKVLSDPAIYTYENQPSVSLDALTFEISGRRRQDARPGLAKMYRVPPSRAWWPAVGAPLERG